MVVELVLGGSFRIKEGVQQVGGLDKALFLNGGVVLDAGGNGEDGTVLNRSVRVVTGAAQNVTVVMVAAFEAQNDRLSLFLLRDGSVNAENSVVCNATSRSSGVALFICIKRR